MRYPLNTQHLSGYEFMEVTDQNSGLPGNDGVKRHIGKDFVANVGTPLYAPESGTIINVWGGRQNVAGGNIIELQGAYTHRFLHLSEIHVSAGQRVTEGQLIGKTGNSGNVGAHLHHDVRKNGTTWNSSLYNYVNFSGLITQGDNPVPTREEIIEEYLVNRGAHPSEEEIRVHSAGTWKSMSLGFRRENDDRRSAVAAQVNNMANKISEMQQRIDAVLVDNTSTKAQLAAALADASLNAKEIADLQTKLIEAQNKPAVIKEVPVVDPTIQTKLDDLKTLLTKVFNLQRVLPAIIGKLIKRSK